MEDIKTIFVKGMVCDRCITVLTRAFNDLGLEVKEINLGSVTLAGTSQLTSIDSIENVLKESGFELLTNRNLTIIQETKLLIDDVINDIQKYDVRVKFSKVLSDKFHMDYDTISSIFSSAENITIEKYMIKKRLEKVKELLIYSDATLTEIAYLTGFSSIQHLSNQFKDLTGLSPSQFRKVKVEKQKLTGTNSQIQAHRSQNSDSY